MNAKIKKLKQTFESQKDAFLRNQYPTLKEREERLDAILGMIVTNRVRIQDAIREDFGIHPDAQSDFLDVFAAAGRITETKQHLAEWMAVSFREVNPQLYGNANVYMRLEPKGVIGNIAAWNFPIDIALGPLAEILAAGNRAIIKPSDMTMACSALLEEIVPPAIDPDIVAVAAGDVELAKAFSSLPWDHLMYTGNPNVAKSIAAEAAKNLTPLTLELGGKCPVILTEDTVNAYAIEHALRVKMIKSGQMCVTPDYMIVPRSKLEDVVKIARSWMRENAPDYTNGNDITSIINDHHYQRLQCLLEELNGTEAEIIQLSDEGNASDRRMPLTMVINPPINSRLMQEEIFGPILPVITHDGLDDAIAYINAGGRPLGLYAFTDNAKEKQKIIDQTHSGGVTINSVALHAGLTNLGFGGSGMSGYGLHHGIEGFREFSNHRGIMEADKDALGMAACPPYGAVAEAIIGSLV